MLLWLARDKHPGLLRKSVNYGQKSFITLAPGPGDLQRGGVGHLEAGLDGGQGAAQTAIRCATQATKRRGKIQSLKLFRLGANVTKLFFP
jgi:hypothetical protein